MKLLPILIGVKVWPPGWKLPILWVPFFLVWPLIALFLFFVYVVGVALTAAIRPADLSRFHSSFGALYALLCETRGTRVDVSSGDLQVFITVV